MLQGINPDYVQRRRNGAPNRSFAETVRLCHDAGFCDLDHLSDISGDDFEAAAAQDRQDCDAAGVRVHQSHCPFYRYKPDGPALFARMAPRAARAAAILGARYFVIHADEWPAWDQPYSIRQSLNKNYDIVAPVVETCLQLGVIPAFENLFDDPCRPDDHGRTRYCSQSEELLTLIGRFKDPRIGICLDTGHAYCAQKEHALGMVRALAPYVTCTHVHDNNSRDDLHLPGCLGSLDLETVWQILQKAGYSGIFTWEMVYGRWPDELLPDFLQLLHKTGEYLLR